jgi:hypothetical protein
MPEITFSSEEPPDRPDQMTPEWFARWEVICMRLMATAASRGGTPVRHGDDLVLHAPRQGACIRVFLDQPGIARIDADDLHLSTDWGLTDDDAEDLEKVVAAVMDGRAEVQVLSSFKVRHAGGGSSGSFAEPISWNLPAWDV